MTKPQQSSPPSPIPLPDGADDFATQAERCRIVAREASYLAGVYARLQQGGSCDAEVVRTIFLMQVSGEDLLSPWSAVTAAWEVRAGKRTAPLTADQVRTVLRGVRRAARLVGEFADFVAAMTDSVEAGEATDDLMTLGAGWVARLVGKLQGLADYARAVRPRAEEPPSQGQPS